MKKADVEFFDDAERGDGSIGPVLGSNIDTRDNPDELQDLSEHIAGMLDYFEVL